MNQLFDRLTGANVVEIIRNWQSLWNDRIITQLRRFEIIGGPGISVQQRPTGTVIALAPQESSRRSGSFTLPLWQVTMQDDKLQVSGGWYNLNGLEVKWFEGGKLSPGEGILCVCSEPKDKMGNWTPVTLKIMKEPGPCAFPIAQVEKKGSRQFIITQYPVTVATIFYSKKCPIATL